jgi:hypothetical protein
MRSASLLLVGLLTSLPASAQVIVGRILEAGTAAPVPLVSVTAVGPDDRPAGRARSGPDGRFQIELRAPGSLRLRAERTGYATVLTRAVEVRPRATLEVDVQISAQALTIEPLTITALREPPRRQSLAGIGYYQREAAGLGHFLRREDVETQAQTNIAQLLDRQPGIQLFLDRRGRAYVSFGRAQASAGTLSRTQHGRQDVCLPKVYLDGNLMFMEAPGSNGPTLNDMVQPEQIEAVEMYSSPAQIPPQYGGSDAACGVILIWTRQEP